MLAHVPSFGRNPRGSPDFLAYPVPKACMHALGTRVPRRLGVARSASSPKAALALGCSLTPGLRISFGRVTCMARAASVPGLWALGFLLLACVGGWVRVAVGRGFCFHLPVVAGVLGGCVWARFVVLSLFCRLFVVFVVGLWCRPAFGTCVVSCAFPLPSAVSGSGVRCGRACWARVSAVPRPSWLGCRGVFFALFFFRLLGVPVPLWSLPPSPFFSAGLLAFFFLWVSACFGAPFPGGPLFLAWCCRFLLGGPPVPVWGSCLRCPLGGGFGLLLCFWRAVWWLWALFARPPFPRPLFFWGGGGRPGCSSLCLPSAGACSVAGVWCGWSLATPGGGSCVLLPATPGWVSLPVVVGGPRHSWLGSAGGGGVWCVVCGGGVLLGLWLVCGVVGPSPLLAEVPVCYSPPLLAGFRCRWWWAVPATPGWGPLAALLCGVWCVAVVCWWGCGWCVVWLVPRHSWRRFLCATPRHSWLGFAAGGGGRSPPLLAGVRLRRWCVVCGVWCVVCGGGVLVGLWLVCGVVGPSPLLAVVPLCFSPPLLAGFRCRWWWAVPATPGWGPLAAVVCGVWCVVCGGGVLMGLWLVCGVWRWCVVGVVVGVWCGWSLATPGGGPCVLLPATPGWVSLPVVVGGPRHSWLGSVGGGGVWCVVCGVLVGSLATPGGGSCVLLPASPGWVSLAAVVCGVWCVVCGGGVLLGLWLVCGVVGPSPLLAEVPVCYSPPTLARFRCRWWWAVPATPGWGPLAAVVCGVWCVVCGGGVLLGLWLVCGVVGPSPLLAEVPVCHSPPLLAGFRCRWWWAVPATPGWGPLAAVVCGVWCVGGVPRHSWRRFLCATPRHSWLGFAAAGGGRSPPLLAGVRWRRWSVVCGVLVGSLATPGGGSCVLLPATPGWVSLPLVVGGPRHSWLGSAGGGGVWCVFVCVLCLAGSGGPASRARSGAPHLFLWPVCLPALPGPLRAGVAPLSFAAVAVPRWLFFSASRCLALRALPPRLCLPLGRWLLFGGCSPAPLPFCVSRFSSLLLGALVFFFFFLLLLLPLCAPVVSGFLWFPAPGALGLGACVVCFVCLPFLGSPCACRSCVLSAWLLAAPAWLLPPPPLCVSRFSFLPLGAVCRVVLCFPGCGAAPRCCALCRPVFCCRVLCCARVVPLFVAPCPLALPVALGPCALRRCVLRVPPRCVLCAVCVLSWRGGACCCSPLCLVLCVSRGAVLCVPCALRSVRCCASLCWCARVVLFVWCVLLLAPGAVVRCCVLCCFLWCAVVRCWVWWPVVVCWWRVSVSVSLSGRVVCFPVVGVVCCGALLSCVVFCGAVLSRGAVLLCSAVVLRCCWGLLCPPVGCRAVLCCAVGWLCCLWPGGGVCVLWCSFPRAVRSLSSPLCALRCLVVLAVVPCFPVSCAVALCCRVVLCCRALLSFYGAVCVGFALLRPVVRRRTSCRRTALVPRWPVSPRTLSTCFSDL